MPLTGAPLEETTAAEEEDTGGKDKPETIEVVVGVVDG